MKASEFLRLFPPGRMDCYGLHDGRRERVVWETLTTSVIEQHLAGNVRLGLFPLTLEGHTAWGVIDIDNDKAAPVDELVGRGKQWGLTFAVERSKRKGHHLWVFCDTGVSAAKVRTVLLGVLKSTRWRDLEIFPKQSIPGKDGPGNYLYHPYQGHSVKEGRTVFIDIHKIKWPPFANQVAYLQRLPRYSEADLDKIMAEQGLTVQAPRTETDKERPASEGTTLPLPPCAAKFYAEGVTEGNRANSAHYLARHFRRRGLSEEAVIDLLSAWNTRNRPPLGDRPLGEGIRSAFEKGYTSLGCESWPGAKEICGDVCVLVKAAEEKPIDISLTDVVCLVDVTPEEVEWLWLKRLPRGKIILLISDPGLGKSAIITDVSARITTGRDWPDGGRASLGNVVMLTAEDGLGDTVRPRLDAAGGDPSRVFVLRGMRDKGQSRMFNLSQDLKHLERLVLKHRAVLVSVDPISAYLGKVDSYRDADIRAVLGPLAAMAEQTHAAVVGIMHMTKNQQRQVLHRAQGNIAFVAAARAVFGVTEDQEMPGRMLLLPVKCNLGPKPPGLAYRLVDAQGSVKVEWESGSVHVDLDTAFGPPPKPDKGAQHKAEEFLKKILADGKGVGTNLIEEKAEKEGIKHSTLWRAKASLGITANKIGFSGAWAWRLPGKPPKEPTPDEAYQ